MSELYQNFQSNCTICKPPYCFTLHASTLPQGVCGKSTKNHWFQLLSTKSDLSISLFFIQNTLFISQPFCHVCCWRRKKLRASMKALLLLLTKSPNAKKIVFLSAFCLSFFCFCFLTYWDHYRKYAGFDSYKPLKKY